MTIRTPEGVTFSLLLAGPVTRFLAWLVDAACIYVGLSVVSTVLGLTAIISVQAGQAFYILGAFVLPVGYSITLEWLWRGQTLGKRVLRLRVVDVQGLRLQFSQVAIRNLLRVIDNLPIFYMVGGISCLVSRHSQRLGDLAANTIVVRYPKTQKPNLENLLLDKYNSLLDHPNLVNSLRRKVSPLEASLALRAVMRRDELDPEARVRLFSNLAEHFTSLVRFPPETISGLTDERYVTNVVEVLFDGGKGLSTKTKYQD
jgi:uncharacterized RDD family membrane protein YckC